MKNTLFALFAATMATALLADVAPGGCGRQTERPLPPPPETPPTSGTTTAPAPTTDIPAPPAY